MWNLLPGIEKQMARGDHLFVEGRVRGIPFQHHGIDVGDGTVIHLAPADGARVTLRDATDRFAVRQVTLEQFAEGREVKVRHHADARDADSIVAAAEAMIGKNGYSLLEGNCEHFATLCATGAWSSHQIEMSHATLTSVASMATKATWVLTARLSVQAAVRTVAKIHPAALLADGVELLALSLSCRRGLSAEKAKQVARVSGNVAAVGIGVVVGGPAGAVVGLATHESSRAIADKLCIGIRKLLG